MRKRLALFVTSISAAAVLLPAAPAAATTCYIIADPGVEDVYCLIYGTPGGPQLCAKLPVC